MLKNLAFAVLLTLGLLSMSAVRAAPPTAPDAGALTSAEQKFVQKAWLGNLTEVSLGQLAQKNGASQQVKDFGSRMVTDHSAANQNLQPIATAHNLTLATALSKHDQKLHDSLSAMQGEKFDREYIRHMVEDHKKDVAEYHAEAKSATNTELRAYLDKTTPIIEGHLSLAENIEKALTTGHASER